MANNTRFLILPWVRVKCPASHALGLVSRRINADWRQVWAWIGLVETFVEVGRFEGSCYAAANWRLVGQTQGRDDKTADTSKPSAQESVFVSAGFMSTLIQLEREVLRQVARMGSEPELEKQMQARADQVEMVCARSGQRLDNTRYRKMSVRTVAGLVRLRVRIGYSQRRGRWVNPLREAWGLEAYQQVSPELQARVCKTATIAPSYESAVELARCWDCPLSDDLIHRHVQQMGTKVGAWGPLPAPPFNPAREFSLVIMMDGWMARERGPDWGASRRRKKTERIAWHEIKSAVIYRLEQAVTTGKGRGLLLEKYIVATAPETSPVDFGEAVRAEAMRRGRASAVYVVMRSRLLH
jgi:hypothetical protein